MKTIPADVNMVPATSISFSYVGSFTAVLEPPTREKYSRAVYELVSPSMAFLVLGEQGEVEVEVRPVQIGVPETFFFSPEANHVYLACDYGLLGGKSKPIGLGYQKTIYDYRNGVFKGDSRFMVYSKTGVPTEDKYLVTAPNISQGVSALLIGDAWVLGDEYIIGGYLSEGASN